MNEYFCFKNDSNLVKHADENCFLIKKLYQEGIIKEIDCFYAKKVLQGTFCSEKAIAFLCFFFACFRQGHSCVKVTSHVLFPSSSMTDGELIEGAEEVKQLYLEGKISQAKELIFLHNENWYLPANWQLESLLIDHFTYLSLNSPIIELPIAQIELNLKEIVKEAKLYDMQAQAIASCCKNSLQLIYGGPGTGKSHTAAYLLKIIFEHLLHPDSFEVVIAAATGKASAQLFQKILSIIPALKNYPLIKAMTLHSLLDPHRLKKEGMLSADLIIIDESSMIDIRLMSTLLQFFKKGARLVLIGDPQQIPPIGTGQLFKELKSCLTHNQVSLDQNKRSEHRGLHVCAESVRLGEAEQFFSYVEKHHQCISIKEFEIEKIYSIQQDLIKKTIERFLLLRSSPTNQLMTKLKQYCLLSPFREGYLGIDYLNHQIYERYKAIDGPKIVPIIITENSPKKELYNGDVGILNETENVAHFFATSGEIKTIPIFFLPSFEMAYAISIHKSQGSEYEEIDLILPEETILFGKEVLYTGLTRAKKKIEIYGSKKVIHALIKKETLRFSGFSSRFLQKKWNQT